MLFANTVCNYAKRCICLLQVDARIQSCEKRDTAPVALLPEFLEDVLVFKAQGARGCTDRHESIHAQERVGAEESLWGNADNGHRAIVNLQRFSDDVRVAIESLLPIGVAQ